MNKSIFRAGQATLAFVLALGVFAGCQGLPSSRSADEESAAAVQKPGRALIKSTGVDERSREIERSLGAR